jgi:molybdopterin/thiamine biosynthesis adenylyltransferase/molybdopterin converting factor small subunit
MVAVYVPTALRRLTGGQAKIDACGESLAAVVADLDARFPGFRQALVDEGGEFHRFVNVYVNQQEVGDDAGGDTPVAHDDEVAFVPAIAGGAVPFTEVQVQRYSRHLILPEIGGRGQRKLLNAKVLCIGAGGLGSPAALYLAAAGVGTLGLVDFDTVDLTNLHRQILHGHKDIGRHKLDSARDRLADVNPDVKFVPHAEALTSANAMQIIEQYDIVLNGCDNFPTRYLTNDACVLLKKPLVDGSIFKFDGQATVFMPGQGCYRCLFPTPPPPGSVPSCAEGGVLGVLPGIVGCIQAVETIKLILGLGDSLAGRLLLFDALAMEFREVKLRRDPECPVCGDNPTVTELIDYVEFCGLPHETALIG